MPSSVSTTSIFTSSGSERRACFRAFTTASAPLATTARTSPFTPFTSSRLPAASRPCQLKSCAVALVSAPRDSALAIKTVRIESPRLVLSRTLPLVGVRVCPTVGPRVLACVSGRVLRGILRRVLGCVCCCVSRCVRGHAAQVEVPAGVGIAVVLVFVLVVFVLAIDPIPQLLGTAELDIPLERLQLHARARRADLERLAMLPRRARERERKARIDLAVRGRRSHSDVGAIRDGD